MSTETIDSSSSASDAPTTSAATSDPAFLVSPRLSSLSLIYLG